MLATMRISGETGEPQGGGFFTPCVLMMVQAGERDTAQLRELLSAFGFTRQVDALEETLRQLEHDALVCADRGAVQDGDGSGPPRWRLTAAGEEWLAARWSVLAEPGRLVHRFLQRYPGLDQAGYAVTSSRSHSDAPRDDAWHGTSQT